MSGLSEASRAFLEKRGISPETAKAEGIRGAEAYFPTLQSVTEALAYPHDGDMWKLRSITDKAHVCTGKLDNFWGKIDPTQPLVITEGELDRLALTEAGCQNIVSVPNGASIKTNGHDTLPYLWSAKDDLEKVPRIILAVDADEPGQALGEELARRLGKYRCWKVVYPEGCKDANDVLLKHGKDRTAALIKEAMAWPVVGLYEASDFREATYDLYRGVGTQRVSTGYPGLDKLYSVSAGLLTVLTGIPGSGKSTFIDQLMINLSESSDYVHGVCSFENSPPAIHIGKLIQMRVQKNFFDGQLGKRMNEDEMEAAFSWVDRHFKFVTQANGESMPIETILDNMKIAVMRWGIKTVVIDPYNYITRPKNMDSEVRWIGDILTQVRLFAACYGVHVWFVAHPAKLPTDMDGGYKPPTGYNISGSAEFFNKPDFGLTVHRNTGDNLTNVVIWKRRFEWLGREGTAQLLYQESRHRYFEGLEGILPWE